MKIVLRLVGILLLVVGLLFAGQGAGIIAWPQQSFMVNATEWVLYGIVIAGLGLVLIGLSARRRRP